MDLRSTFPAALSIAGEDLGARTGTMTHDYKRNGIINLVLFPDLRLKVVR